VSAVEPATGPSKAEAVVPAKKIPLGFYVEYGLLRAISTLARPFSLRAASNVGAMIGGLGWRPFAIRADRVYRAVRACFPEFSEERVRAVARESYRGLGRIAMEIIWLSRAERSQVERLFVEPEGWEHVESAYARGEGVIIVMGHFGNWELGAAYLAVRGLPVDAVAMHMANPFSDGFITRTRTRLGLNVVFDEHAVRRIPKALKEGHAVVLVSDQGAKGLAGTFVDFFGRPAKTPRGAAVFAMRNRLPVIFVAAVRQPDNRYRFHATPVAIAETGDKEKDIDATVQNYTAVIEDYVRRFPEQYFWQHRRWKRQPPDTPPHLREP
jgi:KDO2-lipid IV(A) lauroyltransferase